MKKWYNSKLIKLNSKTIIKQNKGKLEPWIFILNHSLEWMKWRPNYVELMLRALSFSRESPICFRSCRRNSGVSWPFSIPNQTIFNFRRFIRSNQRIRMWNRAVGVSSKKLLEPLDWFFRISFQIIFEINIVEAEPHSITTSPFEIVH